MGNCVLKGPPQTNHDVVKVVTADGGIMELFTPITAHCITSQYPGHAIFNTPTTLFSDPLLHNHELHAGQFYYLLPLNPYYNPSSTKLHPDSSSVLSTPYRMSTCDTHNAAAKKRADAEVFPQYSSTGVWKVKLVISPQQLSQILSHDNRTEELIENVRTVAKCGNGVGSAANSDHSSVAGSWNGSAVDNPHYSHQHHGFR